MLKSMSDILIKKNKIYLFREMVTGKQGYKIEIM